MAPTQKAIEALKGVGELSDCGIALGWRPKSIEEPLEDNVTLTETLAKLGK